MDVPENEQKRRRDEIPHERESPCKGQDGRFELEIWPSAQSSRHIQGVSGKAACSLAETRDCMPSYKLVAHMASEVKRWQSWSGSGLEHLILTDHGGYTRAESVVIAPEGFAARYALQVDSDWRTVEVEASVIGSGNEVRLRRMDSDAWLDVDLSITPFTNTLPIRRLGLKIGDAADIIAAYIAFPELSVSAEPQRYTRLGAASYKFESLNGDFVREITVDEDGLVVTYPDLFRRV